MAKRDNIVDIELLSPLTDIKGLELSVSLLNE